MKRLITLVLIISFSVTILSPTLSAVCPDPNWRPPWRQTIEEIQQGDDTGWGEPVDQKRDFPKPFLFIKDGISYFIILLLNSANPEQPSNDEDKSFTDIDNSRRANPQ